MGYKKLFPHIELPPVHAELVTQHIGEPHTSFYLGTGGLRKGHV